MASERMWRLSVFGPPVLQAPDGVVRWCGGKTLTVLAYLAVEGPTTRSQLAGLLWPETVESRARNNLVQLLRRMVPQYGEALVTGLTTLDLAPNVWTDVRAWARHPDELPTGTLLRGVDLDALPDLADWLSSQRSRYDALRAGQLLTRAQAQAAAGHALDAILTVQGVLDLDPHSEEAARRLMRLHALNGDRSAALQVYQRCKDLLRRDLEVAPLPETEQLAQDILQGRLTAPPAAPALPFQRGTLHPPVLVGRDLAWAQLERAWAQGQFILVTGEAGSGKSRLVQDFVASKGTALQVDGRPGDAIVPYATTARNIRQMLSGASAPLDAWAERALRHILPEANPEPNAPVSPIQLHQAIHHVFSRATGQTAALLYEDLHFADDASIEAGFVLIGSAFPLGQPGGVPHMIATVRLHEASPYTAELYRRLIEAGHAAEVQLGPLDEAAVAALLGPVRGLDVAQLTRYSGGNPLFVLETVRDLIETAGSGAQALPLPVPQRVGQLISQRLRRLSSGALMTARAAAIVQSDLDLEVIASVQTVPLLDVVAHWDELSTAQIVSGDRFVHDVLQQVVLDQMPAALRRLLHRGAARALSGAGRSTARIAEHWRQGGAVREAAPLFERAGYEAVDLSRPREAMDMLQRATELYAAAGDPAAAESVRLVLETLATSDVTS